MSDLDLCEYCGDEKAVNWVESFNEFDQKVFDGCLCSDCTELEDDNYYCNVDPL